MLYKYTIHDPSFPKVLSELKECGTAGGQGNQASCYSRGRQSTSYNRMNSGRFFLFLVFFFFFSPLWLVAGNTIANYTIRLNNLPVSTNSRATLNLVKPGKELFSYSLLGQNCGALLISQFKHHLNSSTWISLILLQLSSITVLSFYIWIKLSFCASRDRLVQQVLEIYRCLSPGQSYGNVC